MYLLSIILSILSNLIARLFSICLQLMGISLPSTRTRSRDGRILFFIPIILQSTRFTRSTSFFPIQKYQALIKRCFTKRKLCSADLFSSGLVPPLNIDAYLVFMTPVYIDQLCSGSTIPKKP